MNRSCPGRALRAFVSILLLGCLLPAQNDPPPQPQGGPPQGSAREAMWFAPTAEDWKKPVLITFQRTWEDALAVSKETQKPILVCINMDGEIASEHYAGVRYRQPDIARLYEPYVCVIASVYRHTPRDYDEQGNRILCPRFGCVTCGEHIAIEPLLFEKFMEGRRIAPRHIMVELDGKETYDVFYAFDTASVFKAIGDGIANRQIQPNPVVRGDRPIVERVASRDIQDRIAVEKAYREGDATLRQALLDAAAQHPDAAPADLLRLAVFGLDAELGKKARDALARSTSEQAVDLIAETLKVPLEQAERDSLIASLARIGEQSPKARTLARVHRGLDSRSAVVDTESWSQAVGAGGSYAPANQDLLVARIDDQSDAVKAQPEDPLARVGLAEATLAQAIDPTTQAALGDPRTAGRFQRLMLEDARRAARQAKELGAPAWRVNAVLAVAAYHLGEVEQAHALAEQAMGGMPPDAQGLAAMTTLQLFAEARQKAIAEAWQQKQDWPPQWLADVNSAYAVLARHPLGTDQHVANHYDFMRFFGARQAGRILDEGLKRFPQSWLLHERLRGRVLEWRGPAALEAAYEKLLAAPDADPNLGFFAGYASIVAAETERRAGNAEAAVAAYQRAIAHYEKVIAHAPQSRANSDYYVALCLGGMARIALEQGNLPEATVKVIAAFERKPDAANALDGMNISAVDTAKMLRNELVKAQQQEMGVLLQGAMDRLDPKMLELPAYERETNPPPPGRGGRGR